MSKFLVYKITCKINNKIYIGQTCQSLHTRLLKHFSKEKENVQTKLYRAIKKYGKENFSIELIEEVSSQEELNIREFYWINIYDAVSNGYNTKNSIGKCGGDTLSNHPLRESICEKIRISKLGNNNPMRIYGGLKGKSNGMYGKHLTEEQKLKISLKLKGRTRHPQEIEKTRQALKGVKKSKSHVENLIKSHLGDDYYREVVIINKNTKILYRFKNKNEYYNLMSQNYNIGRSFLEIWIKTGNWYENKRNLERFKFLENTRVIYYDELINKERVETIETT